MLGLNLQESVEMQIYMQGMFMDFYVKYLLNYEYNNFFVSVPFLIYCMDRMAIQSCAKVEQVQDWNHVQSSIHLQAHSTFEFTPMKVIQVEIWK